MVPLLASPELTYAAMVQEPTWEVQELTWELVGVRNLGPHSDSRK